MCLQLVLKYFLAHMIFSVSSGAGSVSDIVIEFSKHVNWRSINVLAIGQPTKSVHIVSKLLKNAEFPINFDLVGAVEIDGRLGVSDELAVFIPVSEDSEIRVEHLKNLTEMMKQKHAYSTLIISDPETIEAIGKLIDTPLGYYAMDASKLTIWRVTITRIRDDENMRIDLSSDLNALHDMAGAHMKSITLPYEPYLHIEDDCEPGGLCNHVRGKTNDIMEFLAQESNFTFSVWKEPSGLWGSTPLPNQTNSDVEGIFGTVLDGSNDLPLSLWDASVERSKFVDFTLPYESTELRCFASISQFSNRDLTFFLKPLTVGAWILVALIALISISGDDLMERYYPHGKLIGRQLWMSVAGLSCVLITSYYSGAQTMFLTSNLNFPFEKVDEGLRRSNEWDYFVSSAEQDVFKMMHPHLDLRPSRVLEMRDALGRLQHSRHFLVAGVQRVYSELGNKDFQDLAEFCEALKRPGTFIIPKSSPFKAALSRGILKLHQMGMLKTLTERWSGASAHALAQDLNPLAEGINTWQTALLFYCAGAVLALVVAILCLERVVKKCSSLKHAKLRHK